MLNSCVANCYFGVLVARSVGVLRMRNNLPCRKSQWMPYMGPVVVSWWYDLRVWLMYEVIMKFH